jgi:two-component system sensor histidine kinase DegS
MIVEYLQRLHQELLEEKLNLEQEKQRKEVQLNNNVKFVRVLEESLDEDFESFSPRKVDEESHKKIVSLMEERKIIKQEITSLQKKLDSVIAKIEELDLILENIRQNQGYIDVSSKQNENLSEQEFGNQGESFSLDGKTDSVVLSEFASLVHKIEMCNKLLGVDTVRCKLELREIEQSAKKIMQMLKNIR